MDSILEQFFKEEVNKYVKKLIFDAIDEDNKKPNEAQRRFEFNRFELTFDYAKSTAIIEDVLDPMVSGETQLPFIEFLSKLSVFEVID